MVNIINKTKYEHFEDIIYEVVDLLDEDEKKHFNTLREIEIRYCRKHMDWSGVYYPGGKDLRRRTGRRMILRVNRDENTYERDKSVNSVEEALIMALGHEFGHHLEWERWFRDRLGGSIQIRANHKWCDALGERLWGLYKDNRRG